MPIEWKMKPSRSRRLENTRKTEREQVRSRKQDSLSAKIRVNVRRTWRTSEVGKKTEATDDEGARDFLEPLQCPKQLTMLH